MVWPKATIPHGELALSQRTLSSEKSGVIQNVFSHRWKVRLVRYTKVEQTSVITLVLMRLLMISILF